MSMIDFFQEIEKNILSSIDDILNLSATFAGGASILAISFTSVWFVFKSHNIMMGYTQEPFLEILKDFLIKFVIFFFISISASEFTDLSKSFLINPTIELAEEISGAENTGVFAKVGKLLDDVVEGMTTATSPDEKSSEKGAWGKIKSFSSSIYDAIDVKGWLTTIGILLKLMIISAGALYMGIISFMTVLTSRIFAFVSLAAAPIFLLFSAFTVTRNWFWSWFASTLGYLFTFVAVFMVWGFMLNITQSFFFDPTRTSILTWESTAKSFFACFFMAKVIARIGDLASSWFSAGNITDGTNALFAALGYGSIGKANSRVKEHHENRRRRKSNNSEKSKPNPVEIGKA